MNSISPVSMLADYIEQTELEETVLAEEYRYASLPLCVVDAVFSIGVRYTNTQKVVANLCKYNSWPRLADSRYSRSGGQQLLTDLILVFEEVGVERMAQEVFQNRQRTSSRSGILKSEAVLKFCGVLARAGINDFSDIEQDSKDYAEAMILGLPGQSSGIAFDYFMMLSDDDNLIKPDRMVQRYVGKALSLDTVPQPRQTAILVRLAAKELRRRGFDWTPLRLDHAIWKNQSTAD